MTPIPAPASARTPVLEKRIATLAARCALAGAALTVETGIDGRERFVVELRGRMRLFDNISQIEILVDLIGGAK